MNHNNLSGFDGFKKVDDDYLGFVEYYLMMKQYQKNQNINDVFYDKCLYNWKNMRQEDKVRYIYSVKMQRKMKKDYFNDYMFQFENYCRQIKKLSPLKHPTDFLYYTYDQNQDFQSQIQDNSPKKVLVLGIIPDLDDVEKQLELRITQKQHLFKREQKYQLIENQMLGKGKKE